MKKICQIYALSVSLFFASLPVSYGKEDDMGDMLETVLLWASALDSGHKLLTCKKAPAIAGWNNPYSFYLYNGGNLVYFMSEMMATDKDLGNSEAVLEQDFDDRHGQAEAYEKAALIADGNAITMQAKADAKRTLETSTLAAAVVAGIETIAYYTHDTGYLDKMAANCLGDSATKAQLQTLAVLTGSAQVCMGAMGCTGSLTQFVTTFSSSMVALGTADGTIGGALSAWATGQGLTAGVGDPLVNPQTQMTLVDKAQAMQSGFAAGLANEYVVAPVPTCEANISLCSMYFATLNTFTAQKTAEQLKLAADAKASCLNNAGPGLAAFKMLCGGKAQAAYAAGVSAATSVCSSVCPALAGAVGVENAQKKGREVTLQTQAVAEEVTERASAKTAVEAAKSAGQSAFKAAAQSVGEGFTLLTDISGLQEYTPSIRLVVYGVKGLLAGWGADQAAKEAELYKDRAADYRALAQELREKANSEANEGVLADAARDHIAVLKQSKINSGKNAARSIKIESLIGKNSFSKEHQGCFIKDSKGSPSHDDCACKKTKSCLKIDIGNESQRQQFFANHAVLPALGKVAKSLKSFGDAVATGNKAQGKIAASSLRKNAAQIRQAYKGIFAKVAAAEKKLGRKPTNFMAQQKTLLASLKSSSKRALQGSGLLGSAGLGKNLAKNPAQKKRKKHSVRAFKPFNIPAFQLKNSASLGHQGLQHRATDNERIPASVAELPTPGPKKYKISAIHKQSSASLFKILSHRYMRSAIPRLRIK